MLIVLFSTLVGFLHDSFESDNNLVSVVATVLLVTGTPYPLVPPAAWRAPRLKPMDECSLPSGDETALSLESRPVNLRLLQLLDLELSRG